MRLAHLTCLLTVVALAPDAVAQEGADALAKKLANPVASLISVPLQYNIDFEIGTADGTKQTLNIQPVIPTAISEEWNLITRVIVPVVDQDDVFGDSGHQFGLGDINPTLFFSPKAALESSYDWNGGHWNVPFNVIYSKVTRIGGQMVSFAGGARYYLETPGEGPDWGLRVIVTLLFPE